MKAPTLQEWNYEWETYIKQAQTILAHYIGKYYTEANIREMNLKLVQLRNNYHFRSYNMPKLAVTNDAPTTYEGEHQLTLRVYDK